MEVFITDHAKERSKKRKKSKDPLNFARLAWKYGQEPSEEEAHNFFKKWVKGSNHLLSIRLYDRFYFLFQRKGQDVILVTMYKKV